MSTGAPLHLTEVNYAEVKYAVIRRDGAARWAAIERELPTLPIPGIPCFRRHDSSPFTLHFSRLAATFESNPGFK